MKRFIEFDVLRGFLLLMMVVNHSPSSLRRAGRIYEAHLVTLGFAFILGGFFLSEFPGIRNLLDHYLLNPWAAIGGSLALLFRPPLMDILPMYILFSFLTPAAFGAAQRWGWKTVLLVSASIWFIAQTDARDKLVTAFKDLPFIQLGPFDLFAWQLLWVAGLFFGQRFHENKALLPLPRLLRPLLLISAIAFLVWRWRSIASGPDPLTQTWLLDKWHLGPLRLINFFVAASVIVRLTKYLNRLESPLRPFMLIGRHMLPVFCSQICLFVLLIGRTESGLTVEPVTSALVLCQLFTALLFAWFLEWRSAVKNLALAKPQMLANKQQILNAEKRPREMASPSGRVREPLLQPN